MQSTRDSRNQRPSIVSITSDEFRQVRDALGSWSMLRTNEFDAHAGKELMLPGHLKKTLLDSVLFKQFTPGKPYCYVAVRVEKDAADAPDWDVRRSRIRCITFKLLPSATVEHYLPDLRGFPLAPGGSKPNPRALKKAPYRIIFAEKSAVQLLSIFIPSPELTKELFKKTQESQEIMKNSMDAQARMEAQRLAALKAAAKKD